MDINFEYYKIFIMWQSMKISQKLLRRLGVISQM